MSETRTFRKLVENEKLVKSAYDADSSKFIEFDDAAVPIKWKADSHSDLKFISKIHIDHYLESESLTLIEEKRWIYYRRPDGLHTAVYVVAGPKSDTFCSVGVVVSWCKDRIDSIPSISLPWYKMGAVREGELVQTYYFKRCTSVHRQHMLGAYLKPAYYAYIMRGMSLEIVGSYTQNGRHSGSVTVESVVEVLKTAYHGDFRPENFVEFGGDLMLIDMPLQDVSSNSNNVYYKKSDPFQMKEKAAMLRSLAVLLTDGLGAVEMTRFGVKLNDVGIAFNRAPYGASFMLPVVEDFESQESLEWIYAEWLKKLDMQIKTGINTTIISSEAVFTFGDRSYSVVPKSGTGITYPMLAYGLSHEYIANHLMKIDPGLQTVFKEKESPIDYIYRKYKSGRTEGCLRQRREEYIETLPNNPFTDGSVSQTFNPTEEMIDRYESFANSTLPNFMRPFQALFHTLEHNVPLKDLLLTEPFDEEDLAEYISDDVFDKPDDMPELEDCEPIYIPTKDEIVSEFSSSSVHKYAVKQVQHDHPYSKPHEDTKTVDEKAGAPDLSLADVSKMITDKFVEAYTTFVDDPASDKNVEVDVLQIKDSTGMTLKQAMEEIEHEQQQSSPFNGDPFDPLYQID